MAVVAIGLVATVCAAGCGSGDGDSQGGGNSAATSGGGGATDRAGAVLTSAEFKQRGNAICKRGGALVKAGLAAFVKKHSIQSPASMTLAQQEEFIEDVVVPSVQRQAEEIARLAAPKGDEAEVAAVVAGLEGVAKSGDEAANSILARSAPPMAAVNGAARKYGVKECEQP
jgi:hypothetical protein